MEFRLLPEADRVRIEASHGADGRTWACSLATLAEGYAELWGLTIGAFLSGGLVSCPLVCQDRSGRELVLKLIPPWADREGEAAALRAWNGRGAVAVYAVGRNAEALLLDRIRPGWALSADDGDAVELVADLAAGLHSAPVPAEHRFRRQVDAATAYLTHKRQVARETGWNADAFVDHATALVSELCSDPASTALLHGDLMNKNLLLGPAGLVAIDPMPMIGDPHGDLGFWAATHPGDADVLGCARSLARCVGLDEARAAAWARVYAVGEACEGNPQRRDVLRQWLGRVAPAAHRP